MPPTPGGGGAGARARARSVCGRGGGGLVVVVRVRARDLMVVVDGHPAAAFNLKAKFFSRIEANMSGSSLPEAARANMLAGGPEMVDAALAASQKRKAHITGAPQPKNWIPEFQITEQGKATWCGIEVQRGHNDRVWTKWEDEWYYLEGPDPRFNVWDRARHSWVKSWVRARQERLGLELRKQLRMMEM
jgi:hypothetical protein